MSFSTITIAEKLGMHVSVVENYEEEWVAQNVDLPEPDESFAEFLCRTFAECAFLVTATEGDGNAMECLEAYDEAYAAVELILG
jgi:ActR/RegA family two-component response regulator